VGSIKLTKKNKVIVTIAIVLLLLFISFRYIKPFYTYTITNNELAIKESISTRLKQAIQIHMIKDIDNKKIVLFSIGSDIGFGRLRFEFSQI